MSYILTVSDVHLKDPQEIQDFSLKINSELFFNAQEVFFLGDIFDLLVGNFKEYQAQYFEFFEALEKLVSKVEKVYFFEGNHDFNIQKILPNIEYYRSPLILKRYEKKIMFCHGDEIEIQNLGYQIYKKIIRSTPILLLGDEIFGHKGVGQIGQFLGENSRGKVRNYSRDYRPQKIIREKFRHSAIFQFEKDDDLNVIVAGHSHCEDYFFYKYHQLYVNNGYYKTNRKIIKISKKGVELV